MKVFILLVVLVAYAVSDDSPEWTEFKKRYGISYDDEVEDIFRMRIYFNNKYRIDEHNGRYEEEEFTYRLAMNKFGAYLDDEIPLMALNQENELAGKPFPGKCKSHQSTEKDEKMALDWRAEGKVGSVKDQGKCNSAWAFSTLGVIEGSLALYFGEFRNLSAQSLIDCSKSSGNRGCRGGYPYFAFNHLIDTHRIDLEETYPYTASEGVACCTDNSVDPVSIDGLIDCIEPGNETQLEGLVSRGPTSVMIDANNWKFRFYESGIYAHDECSSSIDSLNHAMLVVGYNNTDPEYSYWLVQNSWGESWGQSGVMKLPKNSTNVYKNHCGIATSAFGFTYSN